MFLLAPLSLEAYLEIKSSADQGRDATKSFVLEKSGSQIRCTTAVQTTNKVSRPGSMQQV